MFIKYLQNSNASSYQFNERIIERSSPTFQHICTMHTYFSLKAKISYLQLHHCHSCGTNVGNDQKRQNFVKQRWRSLLLLTQEWVKFLCCWRLKFIDFIVFQCFILNFFIDYCIMHQPFTSYLHLHSIFTFCKPSITLRIVRQLGQYIYHSIFFIPIATYTT